MALHRTATDVAEMESDISLLRADNIHLRTQLEIAHSELSQVRGDLAIAQNQAREELIRATQMETILQQTSMGLVAGLQKMQQQKQNAREARRASQERRLEAETGDMPESLQHSERVRAATADAPPVLASDGPRDLDEPQRPRAGSLADEARRRPAPDPQVIRDAADLVGRPVSPPYLSRSQRPSEVRAEILDHPLLPKAAGLSPARARSEDGTLRTMVNRVVGGGEGG